MWGCIIRLWNYNMQKMGDCFKTREKTQWQTWLLWGMQLERGKWFKKIVCCNVLVVEIRSSSIDFEAMKLFPILESEKHP